MNKSVSIITDLDGSKIALINDIRFKSRKGIDWITRKIKGVCLHHDLGPLGAAENKAALIRQIKMMKDRKSVV